MRTMELGNVTPGQTVLLPGDLLGLVLTVTVGEADYGTLHTTVGSLHGRFSDKVQVLS